MAKEQTGISGEFWFFSQLQRLGYESYITLGNTKGIDISLKLNNSSILTFEVKSKINFGGSFQHLKIPKQHDHFVVFVNLNAIMDKSGKVVFVKDKTTGKNLDPECYILKSTDLDEIAYNWKASTGTTGYGFEAKLLWYLKFQNTQSITKGNINAFVHRHKLINGINFKQYSKIIWTLDDFESNFYKLK